MFIMTKKKSKKSKKTKKAKKALNKQQQEELKAKQFKNNELAKKWDKKAEEYDNAIKLKKRLIAADKKKVESLLAPIPQGQKVPKKISDEIKKLERRNVKLRAEIDDLNVKKKRAKRLSDQNKEKARKTRIRFVSKARAEPLPLSEAKRIQKLRPRKEQKSDARSTAKKLYSDTRWKEDPGGSDYPFVDTYEEGVYPSLRVDEQNKDLLYMESFFKQYARDKKTTLKNLNDYELKRITNFYKIKKSQKIKGKTKRKSRKVLISEVKPLLDEDLKKIKQQKKGIQTTLRSTRLVNVKRRDDQREKREIITAIIESKKAQNKKLVAEIDQYAKKYAEIDQKIKKKKESTSVREKQIMRLENYRDLQNELLISNRIILEKNPYNSVSYGENSEKIELNDLNID